MSPAAIQVLGWTATAVFVGSYFFGRPSLLRATQMLGATLWITYGVLIKASPIIVANVLVFSAAAWTAFRKSSAQAAGNSAPTPYLEMDPIPESGNTDT
jgi:hypothetical protein